MSVNPIHDCYLCGSICMFISGFHFNSVLCTPRHHQVLLTKRETLSYRTIGGELVIVVLGYWKMNEETLLNRHCVLWLLLPLELPLELWWKWPGRCWMRSWTIAAMLCNASNRPDSMRAEPAGQASQVAELIFNRLPQPGIAFDRAPGRELQRIERNFH